VFLQRRRVTPCRSTCCAGADSIRPRLLITRSPNTTIVIDHLGLPQPFEPPVPARPWTELRKVLELAVYDNVRIKIRGACTLSHEAFPYRDIWGRRPREGSSFSISCANRFQCGTGFIRS
jgi:L-fuconolactonase